ncbi:small multi-drug export protein [Halegenticoccus tardaugens]|uniref:small multi-drug export protein n=1 Tax=Halegenticoccus tardaugens TaxID=2071624 RepID=UPI00100B8588|nr:small multi-drug export protein [Halegenticoccus tardaugens]
MPTRSSEAIVPSFSPRLSAGGSPADAAWLFDAPGIVGIESAARDLLASTDGPAQYLLIFLLAATPLLEILVVIPIGVALGLNPLAVAVVAFFGNVVPIYGLILAHERVDRYLRARRGGRSPSKRGARARRIWATYGLPGLALSSPIITGVHVAALLALGLGSPRRSTAIWMTVGIALWTVFVTFVAVTGASILSGAL